MDRKADTERKEKSQGKTIWIRFKRNQTGCSRLVVFLIMAVIVLSADLWLDYESGATTMDLTNAYQALVQLIFWHRSSMVVIILPVFVFGGRISMFVGIATVAVSLTFWRSDRLQLPHIMAEKWMEVLMRFAWMF